MTDTTLDQGVSEAARPDTPEMRVDATHEVEFKPAETDRDAIEDAAARRSRSSGEERLRALIGEPEAAEPVEPVTEEGPARDEKGRFAAKEPEPVEPPAEKPKPAPVDLPDDALVRIKVNGQERLVPWSEARKTVQIGTAAHQRMAAAAEMERQARALLEQAQKAAPRQDPQPAGGQTPEAGTDDVAGEIAKALAYGDLDTIKTVVAKHLLGARSSTPPTATPEQVGQLVEARLADFQRQSSAQAELQGFARDHADVVNDPDLAAILATRAERQMREELVDAGGDPRAVQQMGMQQLGVVYRQAHAQGMVAKAPTAIFAEQAAAIANRFAKPAQATGAAALAARQDAKAAMPATPNPTNTRAKAPEPPKPKTAKEIIAEDMRQRGQVIY